MEEDIKILEELKNKYEKTMKILVMGEYSTYVDNSIIEDMGKLIEISQKLLEVNKEIKKEFALNTEIHKRDEIIKDLKETIGCLHETSKDEFILKSKLEEILKQRLKKYQDADDGEYKQDYLTRGELELVDRYKECSELYKQLFNEDVDKLELDYIPKSKVKEKIEELDKEYKEIALKYTEEELDNYDIGEDDYIIMTVTEGKNQVLQELLED